MRKSSRGFPIIIIIVITFLVAIIPLYFIGSYVFDTGENIIRETTLELISVETRNFLDSFNQEIDNIKKLQSYSLNDNALNKISNLKNYLEVPEWYKEVLNYQARLMPVTFSSDYIDDVVVFLYTDGRHISARSGIDDNKAENVDFLDSLLKQNLDNQFQIIDGRFYIVTVYPSPPYKLKYIAVSELIIDRLDDTFREYNKRSGCDGIILYDHVTGKSITSVFTEDITGLLEDIPQGYENDAEHIQKTLGRADKSNHYSVITIRSEIMETAVSVFMSDQELFSELIRYKSALIILFAISGFTILVFSTLIFTLIQRPVKTLAGAFSEIESGNYRIRLDRGMKDEFSQLFKKFNVMTERIEDLIENEYKQKIISQNAKLKQYQLQIKPHFLYNSFFVLYSMLEEEKYDVAARLSHLLGRYFEYITHGDADSSPLANEFKYAKAYAEIQSIRFSGRYELDFMEVPEKIEDLVVPRLIIQPLLENIFVHAKPGEKGYPIKISIDFNLKEYPEKSRCVSISVKNSGKAMDIERFNELQNMLASDFADNDEDASGIGVINVHRRLRMFFNERSGLVPTLPDTGGICFTITIFFEGGT